MEPRSCRGCRRHPYAACSRAPYGLQSLHIPLRLCVACTTASRHILPPGRNTMKRSITVMTTSLALLILGLSFSVGSAVAQSAEDLVGTWTPVSAEVFGPNPKGNLTFDANGRFSLQLL